MNRLNLYVSLALAATISLWLAEFQSIVTILAGFVVLFLILRGASVRTVLTAALGLAAGAFVLPMGLWAAMAAFALVQILAELKSGSNRSASDRFREGQKTAERILHDWA